MNTRHRLTTPPALEQRAAAFARWAWARSLDRAADPAGFVARQFLRAAGRAGYGFTPDDYADQEPGRCPRWLALFHFAESVRVNECDTRAGR